jgi:nucleoside-diphosphate-sugar epimerase
MALHLVTTIAGSIGFSIARALLGQGDDVLWCRQPVHRHTRENVVEILSRIEFHESALLDLDAMRRA